MAKANLRTTAKVAIVFALLFGAAGLILGAIAVSWGDTDMKHQIKELFADFAEQISTKKFDPPIDTNLSIATTFAAICTGVGCVNGTTGTAYLSVVVKPNLTSIYTDTLGLGNLNIGTYTERPLTFTNTELIIDLDTAHNYSMVIEGNAEPIVTINTVGVTFDLHDGLFNNLTGAQPSTFSVVLGSTTNDAGSAVLFSLGSAAGNSFLVEGGTGAGTDISLETGSGALNTINLINGNGATPTINIENGDGTSSLINLANAAGVNAAITFSNGNAVNGSFNFNFGATATTQNANFNLGGVGNSVNFVPTSVGTAAGISIAAITTPESTIAAQLNFGTATTTLGGGSFLSKTPISITSAPNFANICGGTAALGRWFVTQGAANYWFCLCISVTTPWAQCAQLASADPVT